MPSEEDIDAQRALLGAHRRTLSVLLRQQATFGAAFVPPAVAAGIADARDAIARAKHELREWGVAVEDLPGDEEPSDRPDAAPRSYLPTGAQVSGDVIVASVGAGAQGVAVGKHIHQAIGAGGAADDRQAIDELLARVERDLAAGSARLDAATAGMAAGYARLLAGELGKTGERAAPSASAVTLVADYLLDNVPPLRGALVALFAAPAVRRALARADAPLDDWLRRRFGQ